MPSKKKAGNSVKGKKMITVDDEDFEAILAEEVARNVTSMASSITPKESVAGSPKTDAREATVDPNLEKFVCANCCANAGKKLQKVCLCD